jgi:hypothetical protein
MEKGKQHIIPESYLKAWCDPATPSNHEPYIWITSADGTNTRNKSPRKTFRETDFYTIKFSDGSRNLVIEDSFTQTEDRFTRLRRDSISKDADLTTDQRALLCVFTAMMSTRTKADRRGLTKGLSEIDEMTKSLEEQFCPGNTTASQVTGAWAQYGHHFTIGHSIDVIAEALLEMHLCIFIAAQQQRFITSDRPCTWFNPEMHKWPPFLRHPGFAQQDIEITLPISPTHFAIFTWESVTRRLGLTRETPDSKVDYLPIPDGMLIEMNQRTLQFCDQYIVSQTAPPPL